MKTPLNLRPRAVLALFIALALAPLAARAQSFTMYVANYGNGTISAITSAGIVSTFASGFSQPDGLACDAIGNLYVANYGSNTVAEVTPAGAVSIFASGFSHPAGLAFDASGNLDVTNDGGNISQISPAGTRNTLHYGLGAYPGGLAFDGSGNLYATSGNGGNDTVAKITPAGLVSTFASGFSFSNAAEAPGMAFDGSGNLYVSEPLTGKISKITPAGEVSTFASGLSNPTGIAIFLVPAAPTITSQPQNQGMFNGRAVPAAFGIGVSGAPGANVFQWQLSTDSGVTWTPVSDNATYSGTTLPTLTLNGVTPAMSGYEYECVVANAIGSVTSNPAALTGTLPFVMYVANKNSGTVSVVTPSGVSGLFASGFNQPWGLALDGAGDLFVANSNAGTVSKVTPSGIVSTFASGFNDPTNLACDSNGNLYVSDSLVGIIAKVTPAGVISTFASGFSSTSNDVSEGLAFDGNGNLYATDFERIAKITPAGAVSTFLSGIREPDVLACDGGGDLIVSQLTSITSSISVTKITPTGTTSTLLFKDPSALAIDNSGNFYLTTSGSTISQLTPGGSFGPFASGFNGATGLAIVLSPAQPTIALPPQNQHFLNGRMNNSPAIFGVSVGGAPGVDTFQWQLSTDGGATWIPLANNATYSGVNSSILTVVGPNSAMSGDEFECVVTNSVGSATSSPATLKPWPFFIYLADFAAGTISTVTPAGDVTTIASGLSSPSALAVDGGGNLLVANAGNNRISKITLAGTVSTFASGFNDPSSLAFDGNGNLFVANSGSGTISKITPAGAVSTFASGLSGIQCLAFDGSGNLHVDGYNLYEITPAGAVSLLDEYGDGNPVCDLAFDGGGNLYITGIESTISIRPRTYISELLLFLPNGEPCYETSESATMDELSLAIVAAPAAPTITSQPKSKFFVNGQVLTVEFDVIVSGAPGSNSFQWQVSPDGGATWTPLTDNAINRGTTGPDLTLTGVTSAMSGNEYECVVTNALGTITSSPAILSSFPFLMYVIAGGDLYQVTPAGGMNILATGFFNELAGMVFDRSGNLYIAHYPSYGNISKITPEGSVTTVASYIGEPTGLALDQNGNLYVSILDGTTGTTDNNTVSMRTPAGAITTFASGFNQPAGLAFDASGNLYVANAGNNTISKVTPAGIVSTFASGFNTPQCLTFDANGNLYVSDFSTISKVTSAGVVSTFVSGLGTALALDKGGNLIVNGGNMIYQVTPAGVVSTLLAPALYSYGLAILSYGPTITSQPAPVTAAAGQTAVFSVAATAGSALSYQWNFNGATLAGATDRYLVLGNVQSANAGSYTCTVTDTAGSTTSNPAALALSSGTDLGRIVNFSIRDYCGTDVNSLIAGFVLGGPGNDGSAKTVLVRAGGPVLTNYGVSGFLPDPDLALHQLSSSLVISPASVATEQTRSVASDQNTGSVHAASLVADLGIIASNDGWAGDATVTSTAAQVGAFTWPDSTSHDDALVSSLTPGSYTANLTGDSGDTGIALAEIYDATTNFTATTPRLINASGRAQVSGGAASLIAGFVIGGSTEKTVLVRGLGPALVNYGVTGVLPDPQLAVHAINPDGSDGGVIASNTGWAGDAALTTIFSQVGASSLYDPASADCALLVSLPPGVYTANITSASNATGVALVEVYEVP